MDFLLDTNVVSQFRKQKPHPRLVGWLQSVPPASVFMSAATVAEIQCGIGQVSDPVVASNVQAWLDGMIRAGQPQVIDFDLQAAVVLGKMWSTRSLNNFIANDPRSSKVKNGADLVIAAIAIARGMTIVSADTSDFLQIDAVFPLPGLFDPFEHKWIVGP